MPRVTRSTKRKDRRKKILKAAKGYYGARSRLHRIAKIAVDKGGLYSYRDRRLKKRTFRRLWVVRINAAARINNLSYSMLMQGLKKAGVGLDRKMLADLAVRDEAAFAQLAKQAKQALETTAEA